MEIKVFWQANCPNCAPAKQLVRDVAGNTDVKVRELDISDIDGMSEAAFHAVMGTPTTIIVDSNDSEIASWRSQVPSKEELLDAINC
ncbi:MAG: thioredoxin family protein [Candidatus Aenigmarchaeota archaeon]|nr:thioredoxin family protein [Candidatus Aenigmarchaeota archaeon]